MTKQTPQKTTQDVIRQWEIAALYHLELAKETVAIGFKRRLEAGATIESGSYILDPDPTNMDDLADKVRNPAVEFNCTGFYAVDFKPVKRGRP
jgi:hypothetical protein